MERPFAAELRRAMTRRGISQSALADRIGYSRSNLAHVLHRGALPTPETAERLADALDWPILAVKAVQERSGTCALCDAPFVRAPRSPARRYCSDRCKRAAAARRVRDDTRVRVLTETRLTKKRLTEHQQAVDRMCRTCEPEGLCRDAECPLRPVSPLNLASERVRVA